MTKTKILHNSASRNYLRRGDKVVMLDGTILTVKYLEHKDFICEEMIGYIPKRSINYVLS